MNPKGEWISQEHSLYKLRRDHGNNLSCSDSRAARALDAKKNVDLESDQLGTCFSHTLGFSVRRDVLRPCIARGGITEPFSVWAQGVEWDSGVSSAVEHLG